MYASISEQISGARGQAMDYLARMGFDAMQLSRDHIVEALHSFDAACRRGATVGELDELALEMRRASSRLAYWTGEAAGRKPIVKERKKPPQGLPLPFAVTTTGPAAST